MGRSTTPTRIQVLDAPSPEPRADGRARPDRARGLGLDARDPVPSHAPATSAPPDDREARRDVQYPEARSPGPRAGECETSAERGPGELATSGSKPDVATRRGARRAAERPRLERHQHSAVLQPRVPTEAPHAKPTTHTRTTRLTTTRSTEPSRDLKKGEDPLVDQESSSSGVWILGTTGVSPARTACRRPHRLGTGAGDDGAGWGPARSRCVVLPGRPQAVPGCARRCPQARPHGDR